ncbi:hypothetical protein MTE01_33050 [Microbacterium testaceum]|uniref:Uncharacterized protein n=1 Tax=Microbacterium testaceum TaxID=2033 RepID=A0A4Y3QTL3_MICTE|nr:hypothetical protein MTE01_33050 [Microbacterium testaceum]
MQQPITSTTSSSTSGKFTRYGVWFLLPVAAVAWVVVLATGVSIMGMMRTAGDLIDAASISAIAAFFAVPVLGGAAILLDANRHHGAARITRIAAFVLVGLMLALVAALLTAALGQTSSGG